jgi:dihydrofolate reductase
MRKVIAGAFLSLDGVMQAPGGPQEDATGGFKFGGWTAPYWDDAIGAAMGDTFSRPFALLLGRRTYDIFAAHWPFVESDPSASAFDALNHQVATTFNSATKYVATHHPESLTWANSEALGADVAGRVSQLRTEEGPDLVIQGSSELVHILLAAGLIDELKLLIYPLVLGRGKRFFDQDAAPGSLKLVSSSAAPNGVLIAAYQRAGEVATGSFQLEEPTDLEIERRRNLS